MRKTQLYKILFLVTFWVPCLFFLIFYEGAVTNYEPMTPEAMPFNLQTLLLVLFMSLIGASLTATFEVMFFSKIFRKRPFGKTLLYKTSFYLFNMVFWFSLVNLVTMSFDLDRPIYDKIVLENQLFLLSSHRFLLLILYWGFVTFLGLFILQISDKFGQGILVNFLLGKYHQPKVENRIFLFMDLRDSTSIAEKLGHIRYSRLLQDCYYDLTDVIIGHNAQIYQYVGDEVVLTWEAGKGLRDHNCINVFFAYDKLLKGKNEYYSKKYGLVPEFKAGLNIGEVTVAEVGEIKKELAYHGDVLNTAARIQGKCNDFKKRILISESMKLEMEKQPGFEFGLVGNVKLKGKENSVHIYDAKPSLKKDMA